MNEEPRIPEHEFIDDLSKGLDEISFAILGSGLSIGAISRGTRCHRETVSHAANRIPVRYDSYRRIMYFLNKYAGQ